MVAAAQVKVGDLILGQRTVRKAAHTDRGLSKWHCGASGASRNNFEPHRAAYLDAR